MKKAIGLNIPLGFKVIDKIEKLKVWQAEEQLLTKRYKRYIKAVRVDDDAYLYAKYIVCPYCGKEVAINSNSDFRVGCNKKNWNLSYRIPKTIIREWATMQLSLFGDELNKELLISSSIDPPVSYVCPNCERTSRASSLERQVELMLERKKVIVKCEISEIDELLSLEWIKAKELCISFPIFEVATFDFLRGRVYVKVEDIHGTVLCRRDITSTPELLRGGAVYKVLNSNKIVMRNVKRLFIEAWGEDLPYTDRQIDLSELYKMTMFVGYPASFYVCIPFAQGSYAVEKSFRSQARKLHLAKNIDNVYLQSLLSQTKSVRRVMFENPGLFFYATEIYGVWSALKDSNLLCRFLKGARAYEILSALHMRPGMIMYIADYCSVKGAKAIVTGFENNWNYIRERAIDYSCMSTRMREQTQRRWRNKGVKTSSVARMPEYSLPMHCPDESIKDCTINGYCFFWLRSSNEYVRAASRLKNCLDEWQPYYSPVVCVRKKDKLLASIELRRKKVVQARGFDNQSIEDDENLYNAFQKWMEKYQLEWIDDVEDYDEDDIIGYFEDADLPF